MALTLDKTNIQTGLTIEALQVSQSVDAFTGAQNYDITIGNTTDPATSGSLKITGSLHLSGSYNKFDMGPAVASTGYVVQIDDTTNTISKASIASGTKGAQGVAGDKGAAGPNGPQGADGAGGATGSKGDLGPQGSPGSQGASGAKGDNGSTGTQGTTGNVGPQGDKGDIGTQGATGAGGSKGDIGTQGATGAGTQGATGGTGPAGPQGAIGATGPSGSTGTQGTTGAKGDTGADGAAGAKGDIGTQGTDGPQGATGAGGSAGAKGDKGEVGTQGTDGEKGQKGEEGVGSQGATGAGGGAGAKGDIGTQGTDGEKGQKGEVGQDSTVPGPQGATGTKGDNGSQGSKGDSGGLGPQGTTGTGGTQGASGAKGAEGSGGVSDVYNTQTRYLVNSDGDNYQLYATSTTNMSSATWSRSGAELTISGSSNGLAAGDKVVVRNSNIDYQVQDVISATADGFVANCDNSGGTSGAAASFGTLFSATVTESSGDVTAVVISAAGGTNGASQLNGISLFAGNQESALAITVPSGLQEGAGGYTDKQDINIASVDCKSFSGTGQSGAMSPVATYNLGANFNRIDISNIDNFTPINLSLRF